MYQSQQMCSFSSVLTFQQMPGPPELKQSKLDLLRKNEEGVRLFRRDGETEPKKPQNVDRQWDGRLLLLFLHHRASLVSISKCRSLASGACTGHHI